MVEIEMFRARNTTGLAINNIRVTKTKPYGLIQIMQKYVVDDKAIIEAIGADVQLVKRGRWFHINDEGIVYCSECNNEAYWDTDYGQQLFDYCPYCGAKMIKDGEQNDT